VHRYAAGFSQRLRDGLGLIEAALREPLSAQRNRNQPQGTEALVLRGLVRRPHPCQLLGHQQTHRARQSALAPKFEGMDEAVNGRREVDQDERCNEGGRI
jgi:hypothetical protein